MSPDHPVLTGITAGSDVALSITNFTKAPDPTAQIWRLTPDGQAAEVATGLSLGAGLGRVPDGTLNASEFGKSTDAAQPGRSVRLGRHLGAGRRGDHLPGLVWGPGRLYVSNASMETVDPRKLAGRLLRIDPNRPSSAAEKPPRSPGVL